MADLLTRIGLRAESSAISDSLPNYAPYWVIGNFIFAYGVTSSRTIKQYYGIDHQASPREDLAKYGDAAVREGKITQRILNRIKRNESAHLNTVEHFSFFVTSVLFGIISGVPNATINATCLAYTVIRILYLGWYVGVEDNKLAQGRGIIWWASNITCIQLLWRSATYLNAPHL